MTDSPSSSRFETGSTSDESTSIGQPPDPELEFVLHCARTTGDRRAERVRTLVLERDLNWDRVRRIARRQQVTPLVYEQIEAICPDAGPSDVIDDFRRRHRANAIRNRRAVAELRCILDRFEEEGVQALPYKGPVLSRAVYGDVSRRQFGDLDLLVAREDLSLAASHLENRGYRWFEGDVDPPSALLVGGPLVPPLTHEWKFRRDRFVIELGWQLHEPSARIHLDFEDLIARSTSISFPGGSLRGLSPIDRLVVLAHHGTKHRWSRLKWICDVAETIRSMTSTTLERTLERAREASVARSLRVAIGLAAVLFDASIPGAVRRAVRDDDRALSLVSDVVAQYWSAPLAEPPARTEYWYRVRSTDSARDAAAAAVAPLQPTLAEYRALPLPRRWFPLYYLVRPARLLGRELRSALDRS